ncbi:MAG: BACON domain-containing protein, partial [Acidobacteria bacterium]|nr:BACON domain-containing protein [Acidobacteriota bacterium]
MLFATGLLAQACGGSTSTNVTGPAGVRCQAAVTNTTSSFTAGGGTGTVAVTVSRECSWNAVSQSPWLVVTAGQEGQGNGTVSYRVEENADPVARQAALVVSDRQVGISQTGAPCRFDVAPASGDVVGAQGGELRVDLRTHAACDWSASSEVVWAQVSPGAGRGDGAVRVDVQANTGSARTLSLLVANQRLTFTQSAV